MERLKKKEDVEEALDTWHPDPEKDKATTSYKHAVKQMKIKRPESSKKPKPPVFQHMGKARKVGGKWTTVPEEHDCNESHPGMTHKEWVEDQKIEAIYAEYST